MIHVRDARASDLDPLIDFNAALALETEGRALDLPRLRRGVAAVLSDPERGRYLVADSDGRVAGALAITREWSDWREGWFWWIQSVYVAPDARGRGVYRALHGAVLEQARTARDVCGVRLYVDRDNATARTVYEALGMEASPYRMYELDFVPR